MTPIARLLVVLALGLSTVGPARGENPADTLLRLVPADAAVTASVEDLRGHAAEFGGSPVAEALRKLPAVRDWLASGRSRGLRTALKKVETVLGENLATVRDELLGEAVVLALRLPPGGRPEEARGLLLVRVPNRPLLDRLIGGLNASQLKSGQLERVGDRERGGSTYHSREFRAARRPPEFYAVLHDRVFAWSNSEELIQGAIDRQADAAGGLAALPDARRIRERLPRRALASVYVDPRFVGRLLAEPAGSRKPGDEKVVALVSSYLAAVRYAGAALEWRDGLILHTEESLDPDKLSPGLRRWAARPDAPDVSFRRVPPTALVMATARLDFGVVLDGLARLTPDRDGPKFANYRLALKGLLLGLDAPTEVVPRLGPGALAYVERPEGVGTEARWPWVVSVEIGRGEKTPAAIENAMRTVLALYALDDKHGGGLLRVETRSAGGATVTALNAETPFAYAVRDGRLDLGNSADAVARAVRSSADPKSSARVDRVRSEYFPDVSSFVAADLRAIHTFADGRRPAMARILADRQHRPEPDAARDIDEVLALIDLFDAAFLTSAVAADFSGVHHSLGLVRVARP